MKQGYILKKEKISEKYQLFTFIVKYRLLKVYINEVLYQDSSSLIYFAHSEYI